MTLILELQDFGIAELQDGIADGEGPPAMPQSCRPSILQSQNPVILPFRIHVDHPPADDGRCDERGVPEEHIFIETASYNTCLNLIEAKHIIDENDLDQVLIVSDPLHMRRSMWLAERIGIKALSSPTPTSRYQSFDRKAGFLVREIYSYATYLLNINKCA